MSSSYNNTPIRWTCAYRDGWSDSWTVDPHLHPDSLHTSLLPSVDSCTLSRRYGLMKIVDASGQTTEHVQALDLRGKQVRVVLTQGIGDATQSFTWYGYCPEPEDEIRGTLYRNLDGAMTEIHTGKSFYHCNGLEHYLVKRVLASSVTEAGSIDDILPFNRSTTNGLLAGNRSAEKVDGAYVFTDGPGELWSAADVLEYLLALWNAAIDGEWTLTGQTSGLATVYKPYQFDGQTTFLAAIATVVDPAYGYTAVFEQTSDDSQPQLRVLSILDTAFDHGGVTIPANPTVVRLTLNESPAIDSARITHLEDVHYDEIEIVGGPIRSCFTLGSSIYSTTADGWTDDDEDAYAAADDDGRRQGSLRSVYRDFVLKDSWDGESNDKNCIPVLDLENLDATIPLKLGEKQAIYYRDWRLDPFIPFKTTAADEEPRWREPFAIVEKDGLYFPLATPPEDLTPVGLSILSDRPGYRLHPRYGHQLALGWFEGESEQEPELDFTAIYVTAMMATNQRLRYRLDVTDAGGDSAISAVPRRKTVSLPDAELWYVVPGTITDVASGGNDVVVQAEDSTRIVRNDLPRMKSLAYALSIWYGRRRSKLSVTYSEPHLMMDGSGNHRLGQVVKETDLGTSVEPTGTIISRISYRFGARQSTSFVTEWGDVDFTAVVRAKIGQSTTGGRVNHRARGQAAELVVPPGVGGGGGGGIVPGVITGKTGGQVYTVDLYGAGTGSAATIEDASVTFPQVAGAESLPTDTTVHVYRVGGAYYGIVSGVLI